VDLETTPKGKRRALQEPALPTQGYWVNNWIARHAEINPNQLVLIDEKTDRRFTYRTFNENVDRVAAFLKKEFSVRKNDRIAMISWTRVEMLEALFAAAKLGCIFLPVNTRFTSREIQECVRSYMPSVLVYEDEFLDNISGLRHKTSIKNLIHIGSKGISYSEDFADAEGYCHKIDKPETVCLEDPLMILQTGGTTGTPKGSVVTYRMIFWNAMMTVRDLIVPGEVTATSVPLFHIGGYTYTFPLLIWGGTNILMYRWNVDKLIDWIEKERVSFQFLVPAQLKMLLESPRFKTADLSSIRWFTTGGAALTKEIVDSFLKKGVIIKQGYGLTEVGPGVFALDPKDALRKLGSIGKPNLLIDVRVVNDSGKDANPNELGELLIRSPSLFGGYWNNPEETAKAVEGGWFHTGDIVRFDDEGFFYVVSRKKLVIRSGSESIYPEEIERILSTHPKIAEAVVIGVPDKKWGEVPKALIVLKRGERLKAEDVISHCSDKLAKYKVPKSVAFLESVPKTSAGKVEREQLVKEYGGQ
jgi:fatty-acyl-CoA synthase